MSVEKEAEKKAKEAEKKKAQRKVKREKQKVRRCLSVFIFMIVDDSTYLTNAIFLFIRQVSFHRFKEKKKTKSARRKKRERDIWH